MTLQAGATPGRAICFSIGTGEIGTHGFNTEDTEKITQLPLSVSSVASVLQMLLLAARSARHRSPLS